MTLSWLILLISIVVMVFFSTKSSLKKVIFFKIKLKISLNLT